LVITWVKSAPVLLRQANDTRDQPGESGVSGNRPTIGVFALERIEMKKMMNLLRVKASLVSMLLAAFSAGVGAAGQSSSTVWSVQGLDSRGAYTGQVELIPDGAGYRFIRSIDYDTSVKVEDNRFLSWVWQGTAVPEPNGTINISVALKKTDFIRSRGSLVRAPVDAQPTRITGRFVPQGGIMQGQFSGLDVTASETWALPVQGGLQPIFQENRRESPTHNAIPASTRNALFAAYASYHALPEVKPYINRPEFRAPIHTAISDTTDFDFYQQNPNRLRVVNKIIDPISLQETLVRADAYKWTLAGKADFYQRATAEMGIDATTGMLFEFVDNRGRGYPSHDAALWTGAYTASQYLRYRLTGDSVALNNIAKSADGLLKLLEITGDPRVFARTLRKAEGNPMAPWVAGKGEFADLEWKQGGNNDMFKGVMLGLAVAQASLCDQPTGNDALCARIRNDSTQVVYRLNEAQGSSYNRLAALWLAAYSTRNTLALSEARKEWNRQSSSLASGSNTVYANGTADWSGTHLSIVQYLMFNLLSERFPLPGIDTKTVLRKGVENVYRQFSRVPMGLWSVAFATMGTMPHADAKNDALWRLREIPAPKTQVDIDHRIRPDYVMSPFPSLPWKFDWTKTDRTQSLRAYPLFEASAYNVYDWKQSVLDYKANTVGGQLPGVDFLLAYWLGRTLGVFASDD
jgi:hypothetical protein